MTVILLSLDQIKFNVLFNPKPLNEEHTTPNEIIGNEIHKTHSHPYLDGIRQFSDWAGQ
jgi:hypothetical protein